VAETKADRLQTQKDHAVRRLRQRDTHLEAASRYQYDAKVLEQRGDHRGAALLMAKAHRERETAKAFE
jgi:hypothetical protein